MLAAFAALLLFAISDVVFGPVHIGVLAIVPLLFIGFYGSRRLAIVTALVCAAVFAFLDNDVIPPLITVRWTIGTDAIFLAVVLVATLLAGERLRDIEKAASSDVLTLLPNRRVVHERILEALAQASRTGGQTALLFVDLDGFKAVNDRFGHEAGDRVLQHVAQRLQHSVRATDTVGRIGGDEFIVLLESVSDRAQAVAVAEHLESVLATPYSNGQEGPRVGATVGVAVYPADAQNAAMLLRYADAQMYEKKKRKRTGQRGAHIEELALELDTQRREPG